MHSLLNVLLNVLTGHYLLLFLLKIIKTKILLQMKNKQIKILLNIKYEYVKIIFRIHTYLFIYTEIESLIIQWSQNSSVFGNNSLTVKTIMKF